MTDGWQGRLELVWMRARAQGVVGPASLSSLQANADGFIPSAFRVQSGLRGIDLGTGAGVPGVLLALANPDSVWTLMDASERRCEFADDSVRAVGLEDRVEIVHGRVEELAHDATHRGRYSLAVARLFGPPPDVAECGIPFLSPRGRLVSSTDSEGLAVWRDGALDQLGATFGTSWTTPVGRYVMVVRGDTDVGDRFPRRNAARRRAPLLADRFT